MIKPKCDICGKELENYGALLFSPPDEENRVDKFHICKEGYNKLKIEKNKAEKKSFHNKIEEIK